MSFPFLKSSPSKRVVVVSVVSVANNKGALSSGDDDDDDAPVVPVVVRILSSFVRVVGICSGSKMIPTTINTRGFFFSFFVFFFSVCGFFCLGFGILCVFYLGYSFPNIIMYFFLSFSGEKRYCSKNKPE